MKKTLISVIAPNYKFTGIVEAGQRFMAFQDKNYYGKFFNFIAPAMLERYGVMTGKLKQCYHLSNKDWICIYNTDVRLPKRIRRILRKRN